MKCLRLALMSIICTCLFALEAYCVNAPITTEMLLSLRARFGMDPSRDPLSVAPVIENGQLISMDRKVNKTTIDSAKYFLSRAFDIRVSFEVAINMDPAYTEYGFQYSVLANERLVDALNRLVEASEGVIRWRLLEGRIVLTTTPKDNSLTAGDRMIQVDIDAETMGEAMLQLEIAYNQQYFDVPFAFYTMSHNFAHFRTSDGSRFRVQSKDTMRNIVISLLNQWDPVQANYTLTARNVAVDSTHTRKYYFDNNFFYYGLGVSDIEADKEKEKRFRQGIVEEGDEERYFWSNRQFPEMTQRLMGYFDRIYPELAAKEINVSTTDDTSDAR